MIIKREFGWPNHNTFKCAPIKLFVTKYLKNSKISVDPFARNFQGCTYTNDFNPNTKAEYHLDAVEFMGMIKSRGIRPDLIVLDPPYSPTQAKTMYDGVGAKFGGSTLSIYSKIKKLVDDILQLDGIVLTFGWSSNGMTSHKHYRIEDILLVWHGQAHYDTICMAERRTAVQQNLFCA